MKEKHQQLSNEMKSREGKLRAEIHKNEIQIYKQKKRKRKEKKAEPVEIIQQTNRKETQQKWNDKGNDEIDRLHKISPA